MRDLESYLNKMAAKGPKKSSPGAFCSPDGDCVFFWSKDRPHTRERVDGLLTLFRADDDQEIIGVQIKGISRLPEHDVLAVVVRQSKKVSMVTLLAFALIAGEPENRPRVQQRYLEAMRASAGGSLKSKDLAPFLAAAESP